MAFTPGITNSERNDRKCKECVSSHPCHQCLLSLPRRHIDPGSAGSVGAARPERGIRAWPVSVISRQSSARRRCGSTVGARPRPHHQLALHNRTRAREFEAHLPIIITVVGHYDDGAYQALMLTPGHQVFASANSVSSITFALSCVTISLNCCDFQRNCRKI